MKIYITFGQCHTHRVAGITFNIDCIAEIECSTHAEGRKTAFASLAPNSTPHTLLRHRYVIFREALSRHGSRVDTVPPICYTVVWLEF